MKTVLLLLLSLGIQSAYSASPFLKNLDHFKCEAQHWPDHQNAKEWKHGEEYMHQGSDAKSKDSKTNIAHFLLTFSDNDGQKPAVLCKIEMDGAEIEAFSFNKAGEEDVKSYVFSNGVGVKNSLRFGMRGKKKGTSPKVRVEIYGNKTPKSATIKCGAGRNGDKCNGLVKFEVIGG